MCSRLHLDKICFSYSFIISNSKIYLMFRTNQCSYHHHKSLRHPVDDCICFHQVYRLRYSHSHNFQTLHIGVHSSKSFQNLYCTCQWELPIRYWSQVHDILPEYTENNAFTECMTMVWYGGGDLKLPYTIVIYHCQLFCFRFITSYLQTCMSTEKEASCNVIIVIQFIRVNLYMCMFIYAYV